MKSWFAKFIFIAAIAVLGALSGYWLGHHSADGNAGAKSVPLTATSLRAIIINNASGKTVDWRALLDSTGKIDPDLLAAWARGLSANEIGDILKTLKTMPANLRRNDLMGALYNALAQSDPKGFLTDSKDIPVPRLRESGIDVALQTWAAKDPKAALQWIKDNPGAASTAAINARFAAAIAGFATTDPVGALDAVSQLNDDNVHDRLMKNAATKALADALADQGGFSQAAAFFSQLAAGQTRDEAYGELAQRWTEISPQDAATWADSLNGDPQLKSTIGAQIASVWANNDPSAAATWAAAFDAKMNPELSGNGAPQGQMLATAIRAWTNYDLNPAGEFLNLLPASPAKDPAVAIFALRSSQEDPASAFQWVNSISDEQMREGMTVGVALEWMEQEPTGYNQFLSSTTSLTEQQKLMLSGIPPETLQSLTQFNTVLGGGDAVQTMMENAILTGKGMVGEQSGTIPAPPRVPANSPGGANFNPADYAPAPDSAPTP
ncbi:MAG TPA: hypothetical protein VK737_05835 [Opitutales bacterium]|nr:hypothetical protein [Opitutales bacterium]